MLSLFHELPRVAESNDCDFQFLYGCGDEHEPHFLVYEVARDFLSAPRTFAVIKIITLDSDVIELNSDMEYDGIDYAEDGNMLEFGVFRLQASEWQYERDQSHLVVSLPGRRMELLCHRIDCVDTLVARNARHALISYLEQL